MKKWLLSILLDQIKSLQTKKLFLAIFTFFGTWRDSYHTLLSKTALAGLELLIENQRKLFFMIINIFDIFWQKIKKNAVLLVLSSLPIFTESKRAKKNLCPPKIKIWKKLIFTFLRRKWIFDQGCRTPILFGNIHFGICEANPVI